MKDKIGLTGRGGAGNERRQELRAQLDEIRGHQSQGKQARGKVIDQLKAIQDGVQKKVSHCEDLFCNRMVEVNFPSRLRNLMLQGGRSPSGQ